MVVLLKLIPMSGYGPSQAVHNLERLKMGTFLERTRERIKWGNLFAARDAEAADELEAAEVRRD